MSTSTSSYTNLLSGMWGPEGSEINERLKRLQDLEQVRKERESRRQAMRKDKEPVGIVRSSRLKSSETGSGMAGVIGVRRTMSVNDDSDNYGGARPKNSGLSGTNGMEESMDFGNLFSGISASVLGPRKPMREAREYGNSGQVENTDSRSRLQNGDKSYGRNYSKPEVDTDTSSIFSGISDSTLNKKPGLQSRSYTNDVQSEPYGLRSGQNHFDYKTPHTYTTDYSDEHINSGFENGDHNENSEEDHEDDPKYFIERLKHGNADMVHYGMNDHNKHIQSMPIPPLKQTAYENNEYHDMPDLIQPMDNILSVAQEISTAFGNNNSSPRKTSKQINLKNENTPQNKSAIKRSSQKLENSGKNIPNVSGNNSELEDPDVSVNYYDVQEMIFSGPEDPNDSVTYEIQAVDYDSSGDEEGKLLPVRESMYKASTSEWIVSDQTPGKLDRMQEYFTGKAVRDDPNISRELDGGMVKEELEKSFSKVKTPKKAERNTGDITEMSTNKSAKKETPYSRSKYPLDKVKNTPLKESDSINNPIHTSQSENDTKGLTYSTPGKGTDQNNIGDKNEMSLSDKLAKLESLTQEKKRKHSVGENEAKKLVPSYMSGTSASQKKRSRTKNASPIPTRDLKKDVRELKQFVHEHVSEPSTPLMSPTKALNEVAVTKVEDTKTKKEISVQTEYVLDFQDINYVCKHCGKSSFEEVQALTAENLSKTFEKKTKKESPNNDKVAKAYETKYSSKDSVKSLGEISTKSDISHRYKPKAGTNTQSYMKGTTSSRLKNSGPSTNGKARKGSAPEIVHIAELDSAKGSISLKGTVFQRSKAIESASKAERSKPTLSLFRGGSVERNKPDMFERGKLAKCKSVDYVNFNNQDTEKPTVNNTDTEIPITETQVYQPETQSNDIPASPRERISRSEIKKKPPSPIKSELARPTALSQSVSPTQPTSQSQPACPTRQTAQSPVIVEKLDLSSLGSPKSPVSPRSSSFKKPPLASPTIKDTEISPRSEASEILNDDPSVESKGQFTTIVDNPFIKNDCKRRNSFKGHDRSESVWEKAESKSRDSSLKRSNSTSETDRDRPGSASSLRRHNTSAGEKTSVSELTWSDSGSNGSLRGSKSSLHGSNTSLNRDGGSAFHRPRTISTSSGASQTSQNTMLNLLSPIGTSRHPVTGAIETDIDVAYSESIKEYNSGAKAEAHNEDSVNRAHLDFAKKACDMLEFDFKSENDKEKGKIEDIKDKENDSKVINEGNRQVNGYSKKEKGKGKGKKGFLKGKLFRK